MMTSTFWYRMPAAVRIGATGLFGLAAGTALSYLYYSVTGGISGFGIAMAAYVAVVALFSAFVSERVARRDFGSMQRYIAYAAALRSGELPPQVEPEVWRGWLARSRRLNRQAPVMALLVVVFGVGRGLSYPSPAHLVIAGFFALCAAAIVVKWHLQRRRIARLTAQLSS